MEGQTLIAARFVLLLAFLAVLNNGLIELLVKPLAQKLAEKSGWDWEGEVTLYLAYASALLICAAYGINALEALFPEIGGQLAWWVGVVLTAVPVARGSNYIADMWAPWAGLAAEKP